jgi:two-component system, cell cycle sensor histidine kinase and response regulator CckA
MRRVIATILSKNGFVVLTAQNGNEALQISRTQGLSIDLMLSDVVMPGMDGVTLCHQIATERPEAALLLMSGHAHNFDPGLLPLLEKPFSPDVLVLKVRRLLSLYRTAKPLSATA